MGDLNWQFLPIGEMEEGTEKVTIFFVTVNYFIENEPNIN
jgi:hypothetical protein